MRAYFDNVHSPRRRITFTLNEWVLPGYGWVFPLPGGGANVGIGTLVSSDREPEHLRELYRRYTTDSASPAAPWLTGAHEASHPRAWPLDLGPRDVDVVDEGLILAGEAAGLVGPLTGAGIAFALLSGKLAGATAASALTAGDPRSSALGEYERHLRRRFRPWLRAELTAQRWLGDPAHMNRLFQITKPLPPTGAMGARILLNLG
jgi:flavin-dependent dehydrogenase